MFWVFICIVAFYMKLCFFLIFYILWMWIDTLVLQLLLNDFTFNESLWFFEIIHWVNNFRIWRYNISFNIGMLRSGTILNPYGAILIARCLIEIVSCSRRKYAILCIIHFNYYEMITCLILFIYNQLNPCY